MILIFFQQSKNIIKDSQIKLQQFFINFHSKNRYRMSKYDQKISPIKMLNSSPGVKSFQTPAKYLSQKNDTIYQEEYYKEKCDRLEKQNRQLKEYVRIVQTQNKELKTQIQFYRQQPQKVKERPYEIRSEYQHRRDTSTISFKDSRFAQYDQPKLQQIERLLKQIRTLKNNHELEINEHRIQQKRLNKKVLQLEDILHKSQLEWESKCQNSQKTVQQKNKLLEKEIKQLRKSVVIYMEQRDQNENSLQTLKKQNQLLNQRVTELVERQKNLLQEKTQLQQTIKRKDTQNYNTVKTLRQTQTNQENNDYNDNRSSRLRNSIYEYGLNSQRKDKIRQSKFSIHTFNGNRHVLAQQAFQISQNLKSEIYRLQKQIENLEIAHKKDINDLNFLIQRGQKDIKQKQDDLVSLLTKVKPLLLEKHKLMTKENINPDQRKKVSFQQTKQTIGKNAFGLRMLELYLKKYKMQAF